MYNVQVERELCLALEEQCQAVHILGELDSNVKFLSLGTVEYVLLGCNCLSQIILSLSYSLTSLKRSVMWESEVQEGEKALIELIMALKSVFNIFRSINK